MTRAEELWIGDYGLRIEESAPLNSPPSEGGVAAHQENIAKHPLKAQTGWSIAENVSGWLLLFLVACIPFEIRATPPYPTQLQIVFLALMVASAPALIQERKALLRNQLVIAAFVFAVITWIAAFAASDNAMNAIKAATRYSAGVGLMCVLARSRNTKQVRDVWAVAAVAAAIYGLLDFYGFGLPRLFREIEFYFEDARRLSGSFEYPNAAAAYYALSLPLVWSTFEKLHYRVAGCALLWAALILTYSRGAILAAVAVFAVWSILRRSYRPLGAIALGLMMYAALASQHPLLIERATRLDSRQPRNAKYQVTYNQIRENVDAISEMPLTIQNTGRETWHSTGDQKLAVSYHWYDTVHKRILDVPAIETPLPHDVRADQSIIVNARFQTPQTPGSYLLDWDLRDLRHGWFTSDGIPPSVVEADIQTGGTSWRGNTDVSRWYKKPHDPGPTAAADLPRGQLWRAAASLAAAHPVLGIGPDNYRLVYGTVLGFTHWDKNLHSNSLYLEILVGAGIVGLLAFLFVLSRVPWKCTPVVLSLAVTLIHGFFDFFLMTTPIYFAFWTLMGSAVAEAHENRI